MDPDMYSLFFVTSDPDPLIFTESEPLNQPWPQILTKVWSVLRRFGICYFWKVTMLTALKNNVLTILWSVMMNYDEFRNNNGTFKFL
jgi:hypothetical protein